MNYIMMMVSEGSWLNYGFKGSEWCVGMVGIANYGLFWWVMALTIAVADFWTVSYENLNSQQSASTAASTTCSIGFQTPGGDTNGFDLTSGSTSECGTPLKTLVDQAVAPSNCPRWTPLFSTQQLTPGFLGRQTEPRSCLLGELVEITRIRYHIIILDGSSKLVGSPQLTQHLGALWTNMVFFLLKWTNNKHQVSWGVPQTQDDWPAQGAHKSGLPRPTGRWSNRTHDSPDHRKFAQTH